jgi:hypothetical protein
MTHWRVEKKGKKIDKFLFGGGGEEEVVAVTVTLTFIV